MVGEAQVVNARGEVPTEDVATIDFGRRLGDSRSSSDAWHSLLPPDEMVFPVGECRSGG